MTHSAPLTVVALASALLAAPLHAQPHPDIAPFLEPDRAAEIALARTAAPSHISDSATVLVLAPNGFVEAVHGTNGFTCVVLRGFSGGATDPNYWNAHVRAPNCFNAPASRTVLPEILARAALVLGTTSPAEAQARGRRDRAAGRFPAPAPGAMTYMLSPRQYLAETDPHWMPHLMFFYGRDVSGATLGAGGDPIIDAASGDDAAPVRTMLIPVGRWSDGTPATAH